MGVLIDPDISEIDKAIGWKAPALRKSVPRLLDEMRGNESSQESSGRTGIVNPDSKAIGEFQVMPDNVPAWTQKYYSGGQLTPEQFRNNPDAQRQVFNGQMGDYLTKALALANGDEHIAKRMAAAGWYGRGEKSFHKYDDPTPQVYAGKQYASFRDYTTKAAGLNKPDYDLSKIDKALGWTPKMASSLSDIDNALGWTPDNKGGQPVTPTVAPTPIAPAGQIVGHSTIQPSEEVVQPVTEQPETIQAQMRSALDPTVKTRSAVLTTSPEQNQLFGNSTEFTPVPVKEGTLWVNNAKAKKLKLKTPQDIQMFVERNPDGMTRLLGIAKNVGNQTGNNAPAVTATDPLTGKELASAVVSPKSVKKQQQHYADQFPGATIKATTGDDVIANRVQAGQTGSLATPQQQSAQPTEADFQAYRENQGLEDNAESRQAFKAALAVTPEGHVDVAGETQTPLPNYTPGQALPEAKPILTKSTYDIPLSNANGSYASSYYDEVASRLSSELKVPYNATRGVVEQYPIKFSDANGGDVTEDYLAGKAHRGTAQTAEIGTDVKQQILDAAQKSTEREAKYKSAQEKYGAEADPSESPLMPELRALIDSGKIEPAKGVEMMQDEQKAYQDFLTGRGDRQIAGALATQYGNADDYTKKRKATFDKDIASVLQDYGSFAEYGKRKKEVEEEYKGRPLAAGLEFAKNFGAAVPKAVSSILQGADIALNQNPLKLGYDQIAGRGYKIDETALSDIAHSIDKYLDSTRNKDFKDNAYVTLLPDTLGQLAVQIGAGVLSGGATVPTLIGASQGAQQQYEEARKFNANDKQKLLAATVGALAAVPDAFLFRNWFHGADEVQKLGFFKNLTQSLAKKLGIEYGEETANEITKKAISQFTKNILKGSLGEGTQEVSENKIDDWLALNTFDPSTARKQKLLSLTDDDITSFIGGAIGGGVGGTVETVTEHLHEPEVQEKVAAKVDELEKTGEITPENAEKVRSVVTKVQLTPAVKERVKAGVETAQKGAGKDLPVIAKPAVVDEKAPEDKSQVVEQSDVPASVEAKGPDVAKASVDTERKGGTFVRLSENGPIHQIIGQADGRYELSDAKNQTQTIPEATPLIEVPWNEGIADIEKIVNAKPQPKEDVSKPESDKSLQVEDQSSRSAKVVDDVQDSKPAVADAKEPWQMSSKEWDAEFERLKPSSSGSHSVTAAANIGKSVKGAERAFTDLQERNKWLKMGLSDVDSDTGLPWKDSPKEGMQVPARHRQVIEEAVRQGKPVPKSVLAENPDLNLSPERVTRESRDVATNDENDLTHNGRPAKIIVPIGKNRVKIQYEDGARETPIILRKTLVKSDVEGKMGDGVPATEATVGDAPVPYSTESLKHAFDLTDEQAVATDALVQAMGLDTSKINVVKGGKVGEGALEQAAWHGSPHTFDKFDSSKIGTGEGHQAYGHGLYFASREEIADHYKEVLGRRNGKVQVTVDGGEPESLFNLLNDKRFTGPQRSVLRYVWETSESVANNIPFALERAVDRFQKDELQDREVAARKLLGRIRNAPSGIKYRVELKPSEDEYLLWDKPIRKQSEKIKKALGAIEPFEQLGITRSERDSRFNTLSGEELYRFLGDKKSASEKLKSLGVRGIKYLDGASRIDEKIATLQSHIDASREQRATIARQLGEATPRTLTPRGFKMLREDIAQIDGRIKDYKEQIAQLDAGRAYNYVLFDHNDVEITDIFKQGTKGSAEIVDNGKAIIRGLENPDVSTAAHEIAHVARRQLFNRDLKPEQRAGITDEDINTAEKWAGATNGWDTPAEEKFARGFERYLLEGKSPVPEMDGVFAKFKNWLTGIYKTITGSDVDIKISPEMKAVFDKLVTPDNTAPEKPTAPDLRARDRVQDTFGRKGTVFADREGNLHVEQDGTKARLPLSDKWSLLGKRPLERNGLKKGDVVQKKNQLGKVYEYGGQLRVKWTKDGKVRSESLSDKWNKTANSEAGAVDPSLLTFGLDKTISEDIAPGLRKAAQGLRGAVDDVKKLVFASGRGESAKLAATSLRAETGKMARSAVVAEHALKEARNVFAKSPIEDNYDFIAHVEGGSHEDLPPAYQPIAKELRRLLDESRDRVQALGTGKLENYIENYFPHIWDDPKKASGVFSALAKRPFEGSKAFLKKRVYNTFQEGLDAGLKPVSDNPVDLTLLKIRDMDKYVAAHRTIAYLKSKGLAGYVKTGQKAPEGSIKINDKISEIKYQNDKGELVTGGHLYAVEPAATILNNYLSPGLTGSKYGAIRDGYKAWRWMGNLMNQAQLGLSGFHAMFTTIDAVTSKLALGINQLADRRPLAAARSIAELPVSPITNFLRGNKVLKEGLSPGSTNEDTRILADTVAEAGGRFKMDDFYQTKAAQKMVDAFKRGNILGGIVRTPTGVLDLASRPLMEYLVPRQKLGVFADMAKDTLGRLGPDATVEQKREAIQKDWDSVDNRMGQLVYDNLFWDKTVKDLAMASVRSVGWNLGDVRELGGAVKDVVTLPARVKRAYREGKQVEPIVTRRMAYAAALPLVAGTIGAVTQYLFTGKGPEELKDYFFPKTGNVDENGTPERLSLPTYMKDIYAYKDHPGKTLANKLHPLIGLTAQMLSNKDYYGTEIRNSDDPFVEQLTDSLKFLGKGFTPFSVQGFLKEKDRQGTSASKALSFIGFNPAPKDIDNTKAENMAYEWYASQKSGEVKTKETAARNKELSDLVRLKKRGDEEAYQTEVNKALDAKIISQKDVGQIGLRMKHSFFQYIFGRMTIDDAVDIYEAATPEERDSLQKAMKTKVHNASEKGHITPNVQKRLDVLGLK